MFLSYPLLRYIGIQDSATTNSIGLLSIRLSFLKYLARASTLPKCHQTVLNGGSTKAISAQEGIPDKRGLSEVMEDLCTIFLAIHGVVIDSWEFNFLKS